MRKVWRATREVLPRSGQTVLGWSYGRAKWRHSLCRLVQASDGFSFWIVDGSSGPGIPAPKYWQPLPPGPVGKIDGRGAAAQERHAAYRKSRMIQTRNRLILECRDKGMTLEKTAAAVKHLDPSGQGWCASHIGQVIRRVRGPVRQ